jgi:hypothetical protein
MANNKRNPKKSVEPEPSVPKKETQNPPKRRKPSPSPSEKSESPSPVKPEAPPKHPGSAYFIFAAQQRQAVAKENPGLKGKDISKLLGKLWKEMPEDKKEDYREIQREEKAAYDRYMETHKDVGGSSSPKPAQKRKASDDNPKPKKKKPTRGKK